MSTQDQDHDLDQVFTTEQQEVVQALINKAADERDQRWKTEIAGLNRKNGELDKLLREQKDRADRLESESLSQEERFKLELDKREGEIAARERDLVVKSNHEKAMKFATENNLPLDLLDFVPMSDESVMMDSLAKVKAVVDGERDSAVESVKKNGGDKPPAGGSKGKSPKKKRSEMTISEANEFVKDHGMDAYRALPA